MKLKINRTLRTALLSYRSSAFTLPIFGAILMAGMTSQLYALDLAGAAGSYTFDGTDSYTYTNPGGEEVTLVSSDRTIYFQNNPSITPGITGDMSVSLTGGTYDLYVMNRGENTFGNVGTNDVKVALDINVSGSTNVSFGSGAYGLYNWASGQNFKVYANTNISIDTTGSVSFIGLTGEVNNNTNRGTEYFGNTNLTILDGIVGTNTAGGIRNVSVMLGSKSVNYDGNVTYSFGAVGSSGPTFNGDIYGGLVIPSGNGHRGSVEGHINITLNSGTYRNVYGAGSAGTNGHSGNVVINYNGGTIGEGFKIYGTAGATVTNGTKTLNIGGAITSDKIGVSSFDNIAIGASAALTVNDNVTLGAAQNLTVGGAITVNEGNTLTLNGTLDFNAENSITNSGTLTFGSGVTLDITDIFAGVGNYVLFTGNESVSFGNLSFGNLAGITGYDTTTHTFSFNTDGTLSIAAKLGQWSIDAPVLNWTAASTDSTGAGFTADSEVLFTTTTGVTLEENISVASITLGTDADVTLLESGANKLSLATGINLGSDATLIVNSDVFAASTAITGVASSTLSTTGDILNAGNLDLSAYTGKLAITSGTYTAEAYNTHSALAEIMIGEGVTYSVASVIIENATGLSTALSNIKGGLNSTLQLKLDGSVSDTPGQQDVVLNLNSAFLGTVHVTQGFVNGGYSGFGGADTLRLDNSGIYYNGGTMSSSITIEIADNSTGYFAADSGTPTIGAKVKGSATSTLRTVDTGNPFTFTGDFSEFLGHLQVGRSNAILNTSTAANLASISLNNGRTLTIAGNTVSTSDLRLEGSASTASISVNNGATLALSSGLSTSTGGGTLTLNVNNGATLKLGNQTTASSATINANFGSNSNIVAADATTAIGNNLVLNGDGKVNLSAEAANATVSIEGSVSGTAGLNIVGAAGQTFELKGANNSYAGGTVINTDTKVTADTAAQLGTGTVTLNTASSELVLGDKLTITAKNSTGGTISAGAGETNNVSDLDNKTLTNLSVNVEAGKTATLSNLVFEGSDLTLGAGADLTLNNATFHANSSVNTAGGTLSLTGMTTLSYAASDNTVALSSATAMTEGSSGETIETIYSLTSITLTDNLFAGELTLTVDLAGATSGADFVDLFNTAMTAGNPIGFEILGLNYGDYTGDYNNITLNVMNGDETIFNNTALGVTQSSTGTAVFYIPEPSTVTMSLLALAGMLARRRRRK